MSKKKVLLVDDETDLREVLCYFITEGGFEVQQAESGNEAIDILKKENEIDLIVSDVRMPNGSGMDLLKYLDSEHPKKIPTIILTGYSDYSEGEMTDLGAYRVLNKPMKWKTLISVIQEALD